MGSKSETIARHFESKIREAVGTLQALDDADWKKVTAAEKWPVGVTAHHFAAGLEPISHLLQALAAGQSAARFSRAALDEQNAQHARAHATRTKAETIALLEKNAASTTALIRGLSDDQLAKGGTVLTDVPPMTAEQFIGAALLGHIDEHFGSIRKTVGR